MPRIAEPKATNNNGYLRVRWRTKEYSLGRWDDPGSWRRFEELKADLIDGGSAKALCIGDVVAAYWDHVKVYYRHLNGDPTSEQRSIQANLDRLLAAHANTRADQFGSKELKAYRQKLINLRLARKSINQEIGRIVRMFKWATEELSLASEVWYRLAAVGGLKEGRCEAPDHPDVTPADPEAVAATLRHLPPSLAAAAQMQRYTACRPDEALRLRPCDVDRTGDIWIYSPTCPDTGKPRHKTAWRGKAKYILIGPELQRILTPFLDAVGPAEFCFSPAREMERYRAQRRASRRTPLTPSARAKLKRGPKRHPKRQPGARYTESSYANAVEAAIAKANAAIACAQCRDLEYPEPCERCLDADGEPRAVNRRCRQCRDRTRLWCEACRTRRVQHWSPNMLRHLRLTELERRYGIRDAQRQAGHGAPSTTAIYVAEDLERLKTIAREMG